MTKIVEVRNSTAEFLTFVAANKEEGVQVMYKDETIWATQQAIAILFDKNKSTISRHIANIYSEGELQPEATVAKFATVVNRGIRGEIDYNKDAPTTRLFYKQIQNKMHYAVHQHTAAELIVERADASKEHMGLTTWENAPDGKIVKTDVSIAKNYLKQSELDDLGSVVTAVLEFAESRAKRHIPMTMEDWSRRIDSYLSSDERPLMDNAGTVSHEYAKKYAETEFERYRIIQDRLFRSDFEKMQLDSGDMPELPMESVTK